MKTPGVMKPGPEGWTYIVGATHWHYIRGGTSLCKRWILLGSPELEKGNNDSPDNCKTCRKIIEKEESKSERDKGKNDGKTVQGSARSRSPKTS